MAGSFDRTTRSLDADSGAGAFRATVLGAAVITVWLAWMFLAQVPVRTSSTEARLEAADVARPVQATVDGVVRSVDVVLGDPVRAGDPLVHLDDTEARADLADLVAERDGLASQLARLEAARDALSAAAGLDASARGSAVAAARAAVQEGVVAARLAREEAARAADLADRGAISQAELERLQSAANRLDLDAAERGHDARRVSSESGGAVQGGQADLERLGQELADVGARLAGTRARAEAAEAALARTVIRAPVDGTVGALDVRVVGVALAVGDPVATVVPGGETRVVAHFVPADALGRIRPGQSARLRLDGFAWTSFGALPARVERIAEEPDPRGVRVELALRDTPTAVPLQHGLPGQVEVDVERITPAALVLRAAGRATTRERPATPDR